MEKQEYKWIPTIGAPEEYPIRIIKGEFISIDGHNTTLPGSEFVNQGWGTSGSVMVSGAKKKAIPDSLALTWLSYADNKFYSGRFALPKQKISDLFKLGYLDHDINEQRTYNYLTIGMTPGGGVVLWVTGGVRQVQVSDFYAKEVKLTKQDLRPNDTYLFEPGFAKEAYERNLAPEILERVEKEGINKDLLTKWLKRYNLNFTVNSKAVKFYQLRLFYLNAEQEEIFGSDLLDHKSEQRAAPKETYVQWIDSKGRKMITKIVFDADEIQRVFNELPQNAKAELNFEVDPDEYTVAVTFKTDGKEIKITKQKSKTEHETT
ncbi:DUF2931 family protein [Pedobacter cryoconitis]|nr:DUF2931 family protein [Pedobacter cryoconitis]